MAPWTFGLFERGISPQGIGSLGMILNFAITLGLTPLFPPPTQEIQDMIDAVREAEEPGDVIPAVDIDTTPEN